MQYVLFITVLVLGAAVAQSDTSGHQEDDYHTEIQTIGNGDEVSILDKNDKVVGIVDMFENEGYQIDKPVDEEEHECFIRKNDEAGEETNKADVCYVPRAVSQEQATGLNMSRILDRCGNRSIYILEPQDCNRIDNTDTGMIRRKRSLPVGNFCCHLKKYKTVTCTRRVTTSKCCRRVLFVCLARCKKCVQYKTEYNTRRHCHYD